MPSVLPYIYLFLFLLRRLRLVACVGTIMQNRKSKSDIILCLILVASGKNCCVNTQDDKQENTYDKSIDFYKKRVYNIDNT